MNIPLGNYVSVSDVQRDYRRVFDKAKKTKQTVMVLRDNKPDVGVVDAKILMEREKRLEELEIEDALRAVKEGEEEYRTGKIIKAKSLADLLK
ncbi:MAG: hypothetical protein Q7R97_04840 [Candidatus Daviesbacteria bacterium]|nr:hypothetical protein [Candidatus Daviesbacteria bacterium]